MTTGDVWRAIAAAFAIALGVGVLFTMLFGGLAVASAFGIGPELAALLGIGGVTLLVCAGLLRVLWGRP